MATLSKHIDHEAFRKRLEHLRLEHLRRIDSDALAELDGPEAIEGPRVSYDAGDLSTHELAKSERLADADRATLELRDIEQALARMRSGDYGRCLDCDDAIALARLTLVPTAVRCIGCQELYDQRHMSGEHHSRL